MGNVLSCAGFKRQIHDEPASEEVETEQGSELQEMIRWLEQELKTERSAGRKATKTVERKQRQLDAALERERSAVEEKTIARRSEAVAVKEKKRESKRRERMVNEVEKAQKKYEAAKWKLDWTSKFGESVILRRFMEECRNRAACDLQTRIHNWEEWQLLTSQPAVIARLLSSGFPSSAFDVMNRVVTTANEIIHEQTLSEDSYGAAILTASASSDLDTLRQMFRYTFKSGISSEVKNKVGEASRCLV